MTTHAFDKLDFDELGRNRGNDESFCWIVSKFNTHTSTLFGADGISRTYIGAIPKNGNWQKAGNYWRAFIHLTSPLYTTNLFSFVLI